MKRYKWIVGALVCALGANEAGAQEAGASGDFFRLLGAPEASLIASRLIVQAAGQSRSCGAVAYDISQPNIQGRLALDLGQQSAAFQVTPMRALECNRFPNARQAVVAGDRMPLLINNNNRGSTRCDSRLVLDVPGYSSDVPAWAEALQLVYGGTNGDGTKEACSAPARSNLVKNWGKLWTDGCENSKCESLRFAFRQGDDNPATLVLKKLVGIKAFCNGAQNEDRDPLRTDCSSAGDIDWCPKGDLGVLQAIQLRPVTVHPRMGCEEGNYDFGIAPLGSTTCLDGTAPFAAFYCFFPRDCNNKFGCINAANNSSPFNFLGDGRVFNYSALDADLNPIEIPDNASHSFIYLNGRCTGGTTGANTESQIGCLVNQVACTMSVSTGRSASAPVTNIQSDRENASKQTGQKCGREYRYNNQLASVNGVDIFKQGPGYPLSRPIFYTTLRLPTVKGKFDCSEVPNQEERRFCECVFDKTLMDQALQESYFETVPEVRILECGAKL